MGDFFIGCHPAFRYRSQKIIGFFGKSFHFFNPPHYLEVFIMRGSLWLSS
jgi:hypothetical protein